MSSDSAKVVRAQRLAELRWGFRIHLVVYIIVNLGLFALWYFAGGGFPWPILVLGFWGIGVVANYFVAYPGGGVPWVDREREKILKQDEERSNQSK